MSIHLHPDELIFHKVGDDIISAGFGINSILLRRGLPAMLSFSQKDEDSDVEDENEENSTSLFRSFKNLAVPFGLFTSNNYNKHPPNEEVEYMGSISETMHETLLNQATYKPDKSTKKNKKKVHHNNKTKKRNKK